MRVSWTPYAAWKPPPGSRREGKDPKLRQETRRFASGPTAREVACGHFALLEKEASSQRKRQGCGTWSLGVTRRRHG